MKRVVKEMPAELALATMLDEDDLQRYTPHEIAVSYVLGWDLRDCEGVDTYDLSPKDQAEYDKYYKAAKKLQKELGPPKYLEKLRRK